MDKVIEIRNLSKSFGDKVVLKNINLDLHINETLGILGASGTGKSVLAKCIVGLIIPDTGSIKIFGEDITLMKSKDIDRVRKKIGYLFQGGALYDSMTVRENLEFPVRRTQKAKTRDELNHLVEEALNNVGLGQSLDKMPSELSGGMKKRVGLARTLILQPEIILYDEPTTGLDPVSSTEISELILRVQDQYKTSSIIITHDIKCAKITTDSIKLLREGQFYIEGTFEDLVNSTDNKVNSYFN